MTRFAWPLLLTTLILPFPALAQEPVDWEMVNRIRDEGLNRSEVMSLVEHLTDGIGPRLTGSPAMQEANDWTRQKLEEWGLEAHLEPFEFGLGWSFSRASVHLLEPRAMPLIALPKAWTPGTKKPVKGLAMRAEIESEKDFEKYRGRLAGKILLLDEARELRSALEPAVRRLSEEELEELEVFEIPEKDGGRPGRRQRMLKRWRFRQALNDFLVEEKVLATLSVSSRDGGLVRLGGGGSREPGGNPGVPALVMTVEHYNLLIRLLGDEPGGSEDGGGKAASAEADAATEAPTVELEIDVRARFHDSDTQAYNTIGELPAAAGGPGGIVIAGAHLDSWHAGTGATDNAASCAVVMEAVRILKVLGVQPRHAIRVALWSGEEQGLLGSRAYVERHFATTPAADDPEAEDLPAFLRAQAGAIEVKPDHARFSTYFNLDNGGGKIRGIWAQSNVAAGQIFDSWLQPFHDLGADTVTARGRRGTDHQAFEAVGLPGFQFIQDNLDYWTRTHHTNMDVLDHVVREDLVQASVVLASFLYHAAMRDQPLPRKPMPRFEPKKD